MWVQLQKERRGALCRNEATWNGLSRNRTFPKDARVDQEGQYGPQRIHRGQETHTLPSSPQLANTARPSPTSGLHEIELTAPELCPDRTSRSSPVARCQT